jgi:hypothetical protein
MDRLYRQEGARHVTSHPRTSADGRRRRLGRWMWPAGLACFAAVGGAALGAVSITPPSGQTLAHNTADAPQVFPEQTWTLGASLTELLGATVNLTAGPFTHTAQSSLKANTKLDLRVLSAAPLSGWATTVASDQTNIAMGKNTATVSARSTSTGGGSVGLRVTFQNSDFSTLGAGSYSVTVTGTITSN